MIGGDRLRTNAEKEKRKSQPGARPPVKKGEQSRVDPGARARGAVRRGRCPPAWTQRGLRAHGKRGVRAQAEAGSVAPPCVSGQHWSVCPLTSAPGQHRATSLGWPETTQIGSNIFIHGIYPLCVTLLTGHNPEQMLSKCEGRIPCSRRSRQDPWQSA